MFDHRPVCPNCQSADYIKGIEQPEVYRGVCEWHCPNCDTRWGRWSHRILHGSEYEKCDVSQEAK